MKRALILLAACGTSDEASKQAPPVAPTKAIAERVIDVGRSGEHACVVRASGVVDCWGRFGYGKPNPTPRRVPGVTDAIAISDDAGLVLRRTGQLVKQASDRLELVPIEKIENVASIYGGTDAGCVILRDRSVSCFDWSLATPAKFSVSDAIAVSRSGDDVCITRDGGNVVCGTIKEPTKPKAIDGLGPVKKLVLSRYSACAILVAGELRCFALGEGFTVRSETSEEEKVTNPDPAMFSNATDIVMIGISTYPRTSPPFELYAIVGGKVVQWGPKGTRVLDKLTDAVKLADECALRATGEVACWGSNNGGALGQPTTLGRARRPPTRVVGAKSIVQLALGDNVTWAIDREGGVFAWGKVGGNSAANIPLPAGVKATAIAATHAGNACVLAGDALYCYTHETPTFKLVANGFRSIVASYDLTALKIDNTVVRFKIDKENGYVPQEGVRLDTEQPPPLPAHATALVGGGYPCALLVDGSFVCGKTWAGRVTPGEPITKLAMMFRACVITAKKQTRCWEFELESGAPKPADSPKLEDVVDIGMGMGDTCVVRTNGSVSCGERYGQSRVVIPSGAVSVKVGGDFGNDGPNRYHSCAIMADGGVMCWGTNIAGELGDGSIDYSKEPIGVSL